MSEDVERRFLLRQDNVEYEAEGFPYSDYPNVSALESDAFVNGTRLRQGYLSPDQAIALANALGMPTLADITEARITDALLRERTKLTFRLRSQNGTAEGDLEQELQRTLFDRAWKKTQGKRLEKYRIDVPIGKNGEYTLVVDVYADRDLIIGKVVLPIEAAETLRVGEDITGDSDYFAVNLAR